jgi:hypothetical protein
MDEEFDLSNFQDANFIPGQQCVLCSHLLVHKVLDKVLLQLSWYKQRQYQGFRGDYLLFNIMDNANYRYHAYRCYIQFMHGHLGQHNRKVIPACVVTHIRTRYPDASNPYIGFRPAIPGGMPNGDDETEYIPPDVLAAIVDGTEI